MVSVMELKVLLIDRNINILYIYMLLILVLIGHFKYSCKQSSKTESHIQIQN